MAMGWHRWQVVIVATVVVAVVVAGTAAASPQVEAFGLKESALSVQPEAALGGFDETRGAGYEYSRLRRQLAVSELFTSKPLAVKSDRRDPTNKFHHYRGGFDVRSKHYWACKEIALIVTLCLGLFLIVIGLVASFMRWRRLFFPVIVLAWILIACMWLLFGLMFALSNAATDMCQALDEFLVTPVNTTLDSFLPCVDSATSNAALQEVRIGVGNIIEQANSTVVTIQRLNNFLGIGNGSLLSLCDPIGGPPDYAYNATCATGTLPISDLPQVLAPYVCMENMSTFDCLKHARFVSAENNATLYEFSEGAQSMLVTVPKLSKLADCSFVTDTFSKFVNERCQPLRSAIRLVWIFTLLFAIFFTVLTALWLVTNHRNTHQRRMDAVHYAAKPGRM